jgi:hypothetical protein
VDPIVNTLTVIYRQPVFASNCVDIAHLTERLRVSTSFFYKHPTPTEP